MPANNTNTRSITYIGDDPELRKFIHKWDSINFEFLEDENEKKLNPKCGYGYMIHRNVKDVFIKIPDHPYDGDCFAIMDYTHINNDYIKENYIDNNLLIKETPISTNLYLSTAKIYIDNTYDFECNTKVLYNNITHQAGEVFEIIDTCCHLYIFSFSKPINAWIVKWVEKECPNYKCASCDVEGDDPSNPPNKDVKVSIRFYTIVDKSHVLLREDVFDHKVGDNFRQEYKNYFIYNLYANGEEKRDIDFAHDYIDRLYNLSNNTNDVADAFVFDYHDKMKGDPYNATKLICTYNSIDGVITDKFPFETDTYGSLFDFDVYLVYYGVQKISATNPIELNSIYCDAYTIMDTNMRLNTSENIRNVYKWIEKFNQYDEDRNKTQPPDTSDKDTLIFVSGYNNGITKEEFMQFYEIYSRIDREFDNYNIKLTYNPGSFIAYKYFNGTEFVYDDINVQYVGEKENVELTNFLASIPKMYADNYCEFTTYIWTALDEYLEGVDCPNYFSIDLETITFYNETDPMGYRFDTQMLVIRHLQSLCVNKVRVEERIDYKNDKYWISYLTLSGYTPEEYILTADLDHPVYSMSSYLFGKTYNYRGYRLFPKLPDGSNIDTGYSGSIRYDTTLKEKSIRGVKRSFSEEKDVSVITTKTPHVCYTLRNYSTPFYGEETPSGYGYKERIYLDDRHDAPTVFFNFQLSKTETFSNTIQYNINSSIDDFPNKTITSGIYDFYPLAEAVDDFFNASTVFEFIVEGETIINIFMVNTFYGCFGDNNDPPICNFNLV